MIIQNKQFNDGVIVHYEIKKIIYETKTQYQDLKIAESEHFGRMLFLDNDLQITESDSEIYNKAMINPVINHQKKINKVLILGGGDGGVLNELLKHDINQAVMIEIDNEVINASRNHLSKICEKAFTNPKAKVIIGDALEFLRKNKNEFDAVISDLTDEAEELLGVNPEEFMNDLMKLIKESLKDKGITVMQAGDEDNKKSRKLFNKLMPQYFNNIQEEHVKIPSFLTYWVFISGIKK